MDDARAVNVDGTRTLLRAADQAGVRRVVHVSTAAVYDDEGRGDLVTEEAPTVREGSPYPVTKAEAERVVHAGSSEEGAGPEVVVLRPPVVLGAGPTSTWAVRVPDRIAQGKLPLAGEGRGTFPWVHVDDLAAACVAAVSEPVAAGRTYNVVGGHARWSDYVEGIRTAVTSPEPPASDDEPWTGRYDTTAIEADLGWRPRVGFEAAMTEIIEYRGDQPR